MPPSIVVAIREDPRKSAQPVEALRIALGLAAGENPLTVVLGEAAARLLAGDEEDVVDGDILDKYLPSVKQMNIPLVVPRGSIETLDLDTTFNLRESSLEDMRSLIASADRALVF